MTRLIFLLPMLFLFGCVEVPPPQPTLVIQCPQITTYSLEFNHGFSEDIARLQATGKRFPYIEQFLSDGIGLRDAVRQCQKSAADLKAQNDALHNKKK